MKLVEVLIKKLDTIIELLSAEKQAREAAEEEKRVENERRLKEYAMHKHKKFPAARVHSTRELQNRPIEGAPDLIPYGLSDNEREILHLWYSPPDNR